MTQKNSIQVHLNYDTETGHINLIVDDNNATLTESQHDRIARTIAELLDRNPQIEDAGTRPRLMAELARLRSRVEDDDNEERELDTDL